MDHLPEERLLKELEKTLIQADEPSRFFRILDDIGALEKTFPELDALTDVPAGPTEHHQEGSAFNHTMLVLEEMNDRRPNDELALLMALAHDLGKGVTDERQLPSHPAHEKAGAPVAEAMAERLSMSNEQQRAMHDAARFHMNMLRIEELNESTVIDMCERVSSENLDRLADLAIADSLGREPHREINLDAIDARINAAKTAIDEWTGQRLIEDGYSPSEMGGEEFGALLKQRRVEHMRDLES